MPGQVAAFILMICLVFFAFTTILGWDYYGERCLEYLTNGSKVSVQIYRWLYILCVFIGPYMTVKAVWTIADIFNGLMAIPNIIALLALSGVVVAAAAAVVFGKAAGITGYNVSDIETLNYVAQNTQIKIGQLLFSGIIIAALGATMDVGMSIASTIQELHERSPQLGTKELFVSGIRVGRDMMGTMANTLIFAYVGGSLSTLVVNYAYNLSYNQLINSYVIGTEIMQGLSGTLGVVLTVPITAAVAAVLIGKKKIVKEPLMQDIYDGSDDYEEPETDGEYGEDV